MIIRGIEDVLDETRYSPIIVRQNDKYLSAGSDNLQGKGLSMSILSRRDEGVICHPNPKFVEDYKVLANSGVPVVFFGTIPKDMTDLENVSTVVWECGKPVEHAINHFIDLGKRRIGFVGVNHGIKADEIRYTSYTKTLDRNGLGVNPDWVVWWPPSYTKEEMTHCEVLKEIFTNGNTHPDAIFALNDTIAIKLLEILASIGVRVPEDVSVIGMGNYQVSALHGVSLSTMEEPMRQLGQQTAEVFLKLISDPGSKPIHKRIPWNKLIERKTTLGSY